MRNPYPAQGDLGDHEHLRPESQFGYSNPHSNEDHPREYPGTTSSLGPWDSASQRSIGQSTVGPQQHLRNKPSYAGGLSYIDEEGDYYRSNTQRPASEAGIEMRGLVHDPAPMSGRDDSRDIEFNGIKGNDYDTSPFPYPTQQAPMYKKPSGVYSWLLFPTGLDRVLAIFGVNMGKLPIEQEVERKRRGIPGQRFPVAAWGLTASESEPRQCVLTNSDVSHDGSHDLRAGPKQAVDRFGDCDITSVRLYDRSIARSAHQYWSQVHTVSPTLYHLRLQPSALLMLQMHEAR
jgi:hypothetical protein